jgi:pimeloyl-ACP methyl ester carboxylesterase
MIERIQVGPFAALAAGPPDGELVLCLHGFPDHAPSFEALLEELSQAGRRAVAPWMRGYAPSTLEGPFDLTQLASDALAIAESLSPKRPVSLVGHDWGALAHTTRVRERPTACGEP